MMLFLAPDWMVFGVATALLIGWVGTTVGLMRGRHRIALPLLNAVAALCLFVLVTQPAMQKPPLGSAVLLTPGAAVVSPEDNGGLPVFSIGSHSGLGVSKVSDLASLARNFPRLDHLLVSGHGLPQSDWLQDGTWHIEFEPAQLPAGFVDMAWSPEMVLGEQLKVSGRLNEPLADGWQVKVLDPAGETVAATGLGDNGEFGFAIQPKLAGAVVYELLGVDAAGTAVLREPLPVWVHRPLAPRVLMLISRPSFESRFLKNWLAGSITGLTMETRLATEIRRVETVGDNPPPVQLGKESLESVDLLVVDAGWLNASGQSERRLINAAVSAGLGLLVLLDSNPSAEMRQDPMLAGFELQDIPATATPLALYQGLLEAEPPRVQLQSTVAGTLFKSDEGEPLLAMRRQGAGQVAVSLLVDSHSWRTAGQGSLFARLWQRVIERVSRPGVAAVSVKRVTPLLSVGDSVSVCVSTVTTHECHDEWFDQPGWKGFAADQERLSVYAHSLDQWQAWRAQLTQRATRKVALMAPPKPVLLPFLSPRFDPWLIWGLFIVVAGLIWLEHKFGDQGKRS